MRVGIVSLYGNSNMGNKLQSYALEQMFLRHGAESLIIKNKPIRKNLIKYCLQDSRFADSFFFHRLTGNRRGVAIKKFDQKYLHCTDKIYFCNVPRHHIRKKDLCDLYCAGSDQIWNPGKQKRKMFAFLGFAPTERTFSYAASFGVDALPDEYVDNIRKGLHHVAHISVREDAGKRIVEELTGRTDAQVLVDPTLLLSAEEWDEIAQKPSAPLPQKYILTYFLGDASPARKQAIEEKARQMDCKVIELMDKNSPFYAIGPDNFIYMIKHASLVCTDSFHGSVFSFLYQRPLAIFRRLGEEGNTHSRLETFAGKFSLQHCIVTEHDLCDIQEVADYSAGVASLEQERQKSKAFLDSVFKEAERAELCK